MLLSADNSLKEVQSYVEKTLKKRGFDDETVAQKFMLLLEEMGEFAHAARKHADIKVDEAKWVDNEQNLQDEAADVLIYLLDICNKLDIDLMQAFIAKEKKNQTRNWK
jgi:NTP pyrophosphatase (non-canonical NTP hydrolase)